MPVSFSQFAQAATTEIAFEVLATARRSKAAGKDVVELEIGDSPFDTTPAARQAGLDAITAGETHYGPSAGLSEFRAAAAEYASREFGLEVTAENIVAGPGAKTFQLFFCEAFLNRGDGVLVFSPYFPTYLPIIARRDARVTLSALKQDRQFRPNLDDVQKFLANDPAPKAIFLNSPHNPTGGVATADDLRELANLVRGRDVAVFSDEPYDQMVWTGKHRSLLSEPGMLDQCVGAYTFSKSYSMSGWRLGFAVSSRAITETLVKLVNTALSCVPPLAQRAGIAALKHDAPHRDKAMAAFKQKVELLVAGLNEIEGVRCIMPGGTFYVFPWVDPICRRLGMTSHGLAMYLLEGADDKFGVACLGGECFGEAGRGFLRFSCAEPDERLRQALAFLPEAFSRTDRAKRYLEQHPEFRY